MRAAALALVVVVLAAPPGCAGDGEDAQPAPATTAPQTETETETATEPAPDTDLRTGTARLSSEDGDEVSVQVEIAETDAQRQVGLMNRETLPDDAGMLFVWDEDVSFGFWMKDTLIPLSIAFADADGTIVRILDMEPCQADPCPVYNPEATYRVALEVNEGAFERWGISEGDTLTFEG